MWFIIILLSLFTSLLDTTVSPSLSICGGVINFTLSTLLVFLLIKSIKNASITLIFSTIFLSVFSQVPVIFSLLPGFIVLVLTAYLSGRRLIDRPPTMLSAPIFFVLALTHGIIGLLILRQVSADNLFIVLKSSSLTALLSTLAYWLINKIDFFLNPHVAREKIKINI